VISPLRGAVSTAQPSRRHQHRPWDWGLDKLRRD